MMHCKDWEERVALHAGGDLEAADAAHVEGHLAECAACRMFWSGMRESLELLQGVHSEALAPGIYTAVRGRVMAGLEAGRRAWWRRGWVAGLAAAVVVLLLASWPLRRVETLPVRVVTMIPPALTPAPQGLRGQAKGLPHLAHVARRRVASSEQIEKPPRQPLLVRLVTDDPNVVIYWIAD